MCFWGEGLDGFHGSKCRLRLCRAGVGVDGHQALEVFREQDLAAQLFIPFAEHFNQAIGQFALMRQALVRRLAPQHGGYEIAQMLGQNLVAVGLIQLLALDPRLKPLQLLRQPLVNNPFVQPPVHGGNLPGGGRVAHLMG